MVTLEQFREYCSTNSIDDIVDNILLADDAVHISAENRTFLSEEIARVFGIKESDIRTWIVGSAKLGFSITEKKKNGQLLPRYRPFSAVSDIDIAIVSPKLFRLIWDELSMYVNGKSWIPWDSGRLGDYMVYGWLRPDYFPTGHRIKKCDDWWDQFRKFSSDPRFNRRSVRGGLFHSVDDLRRYLRRSVLDCVRAEQERL